MTANNNLTGNFNATFTLNQVSHIQNAMSSGWISAYVSTPGNHTNITASTPLVQRDFQGGTWQWATGNISSDQIFNQFKASTIAFVGLSTAANAYTLWVETPLLGTNASQGGSGNRYAIATKGDIKIFDNTGANINFITATGGGTKTRTVNGANIYNGFRLF